MASSDKRARAQESSNAIERMYITMRHLFNRGFYKPMGISGKTLRDALMILRPEIYGSIAGDKIELDGLLYVIDRLPEGIEECGFINLTSDEGYKQSHFEPIIPRKRRRNCYRIDEDQMNIEITRGRSEIYDILTHLTFLFIESHKIAKRVILNNKGALSRDWKKLEKSITATDLSDAEREIVITHVAAILGRTFKEVDSIYTRFATKKNAHRFLHIIYWIGKLALAEIQEEQKRAITFSSVLQERLGHHIHGEQWAKNLKKTLTQHGLLNRPLHIISANMHSVMNTIFAPLALEEEMKGKPPLEIFEVLSDDKNIQLRTKIQKTAKELGIITIDDESGANIDVQIFDMCSLDGTSSEFCCDMTQPEFNPVIIVIDYAFGEQAYEVMEELLKPYETTNQSTYLNVQSISIMGKAGILEGAKGDIMIPSAHLFEGTADNYPFKNELCDVHWDTDLNVYTGTMVTVLGTSLQNRDILKYFNESTWQVIGLEMEGAHYQKAIQAASKLRSNIQEDVKVRYAYYASDNPLETGSTLASGGLGMTGVRPTYSITKKILEQINSKN